VLVRASSNLSDPSHSGPTNVVPTQKHQPLYPSKGALIDSLGMNMNKHSVETTQNLIPRKLTDNRNFLKPTKVENRVVAQHPELKQ
jgi:hypothetical protein